MRPPAPMRIPALDVSRLFSGLSLSMRYGRLVEPCWVPRTLKAPRSYKFIYSSLSSFTERQIAHTPFIRKVSNFDSFGRTEIRTFGKSYQAKSAYGLPNAATLLVARPDSPSCRFLEHGCPSTMCVSTRFGARGTESECFTQGPYEPSKGLSLAQIIVFSEVSLGTALHDVVEQYCVERIIRLGRSADRSRGGRSPKSIPDNPGSSSLVDQVLGSDRSACSAKTQRQHQFWLSS